ncbi:hypothetical protein E8E13_007155 [Curvularia kusanoi]|uniref:Methyltransferase domain-containing protein n=1 Tax=Curvularia kusanoi TaxID=90978 RepID=A0A9P4W7A5_CURKU|nr:hypothetical protein E8E13_007155 [Curvularia kusanoi]
MPSKAKAPEFGSQEYWDQRFTTNTAPFDWLSAPDALDPLITDALRTSNQEQPQLLHIGCGSSLLSQHLKNHVESPRQVHNVDYSSVVIEAERRRESESVGGNVDACARWDAVDLLNYASLNEACGQSMYSVIVDKSTADAISCADDVSCHLPYAICTEERTVANDLTKAGHKSVLIHPLHLLAVHLAYVAKPGAKWISLSYTAERFPFLDDVEVATTTKNAATDTEIPDPRILWTVVGKHQIEAKEEGNMGGVAHRPKVYHWLYILQRTSTQLYNVTDRP